MIVMDIVIIHVFKLVFFADLQRFKSSKSKEQKRPNEEKQIYYFSQYKKPGSL